MAEAYRDDVAARAPLETARGVLRQEGAALRRLAESLDTGFLAAAEALLAGALGRVIVTGMGKSGHVARKIAATFASTGTPALFVHPAEASHGDLGMITHQDVILALSASGETPELSNLVTYSRRRGITLIAMTTRPQSALARAADIVLRLPPEPEVCPLGLAPTTSTTMMMALGDALAVVLLTRRGFTREEFSELHPGGSLGKILVRVADIMHVGEEMPLVGPGTMMADAILTMTRGRFGCVGVLDESGRLRGIITDGDLRRHMGPGLLCVTTASVMTPAPKTIAPNALAAEALRVLNTNRITSLFVVEAERPVGIVHVHDCLRAGLS
jgi:arabinose-5-phosphate isomerase